MQGWIGVDLDGTLAEWHEWSEEIGPPVPAMLSRVKEWVAKGYDVRIFTARVGGTGQCMPNGQSDDAEQLAKQRRMIEAWCVKHVGCVLPVTAQKDFALLQFWDDRAVAVKPNTGEAFTWQEVL